MNERDRDSLRARLQAGDPYQGEFMLASDAARIKARMGAAAGARVRPNWMPAAAAAAAAVVVVGALGIWAGSGLSTTDEPRPVPPSAPATQNGTTGAAASSDPVIKPMSPLASEPAGAGLAAAQPVPVVSAPLESAPVSIASSATAVASQVAQVTTTVAAADAPPAEVRRIQFTARRGTRIVWTLDPDFDPSTTRNDAPPARHQQGANGKW